MKVLLVTIPPNTQSIQYSSVFIAEPLALEYLGAGIQENHDVKLLDLRIDTGPGLKETLELFQPDIIGCGGYTAEVYGTKQICAEAKKILPEILTVVGGLHATMKPEDFFEDTIDVVVINEGVFPFKKICEYQDIKKSFEDIENIYCKKDGKMVFTKKKEHPPLDSLPFPARKLTSHIRHQYVNKLIFKSKPIANVRGSLGCFYRCKFCSVTRFTNGKVYRHSVERINEELSSIKEQLIFWVDDEFLLEPERMILLASAIEKAGIKKFHAVSARTDTIVRKPECIEAWAKIGLKYVFVGMESVSDVGLKRFRKGTTVSQNEECVRILHANNIKVRGGFIVDPDFDKDDFKRLGEYVKKSGIDIPSFSILTPLPGTKLYEEAKEKLITHNNNFYDMAHTILPTKLPLKQFYKEYCRLVYKKSMTFKRRIELFKRLEPHRRKEFISAMRKVKRRLENAYRDYDQV